MKEMNHLKNAHHEAMHDLGYSEDEIGADWSQFCIDYEKLLDDVSDDLSLPRDTLSKEYRPFGQTVVPKALKAADVRKELPW